MTVLIPSFVYGIINLIIFKKVRSSTNRVQSTNATEHNERNPPIPRRDLHLLRHLVVLFCIFIAGWGPVFTYTAIVTDIDFGSIIYIALFILAVLSIFCLIIDLFLYNHELRKYFREKICRRD